MDRSGSQELAVLKTVAIAWSWQLEDSFLVTVGNPTVGPSNGTFSLFLIVSWQFEDSFWATVRNPTVWSSNCHRNEILVVFIVSWQFEDHTVGFPTVAQKESSNCHDTMRNSENVTFEEPTVGFPTVTQKESSNCHDPAVATVLRLASSWEPLRSPRGHSGKPHCSGSLYWECPRTSVFPKGAFLGPN